MFWAFCFAVQVAHQRSRPVTWLTKKGYLPVALLAAIGVQLEATTLTRKRAFAPDWLNWI